MGIVHAVLESTSFDAPTLYGEGAGVGTSESTELPLNCFKVLERPTWRNASQSVVHEPLAAESLVC